MSIEKTGVVVSRGAGVVLLVVSVSSLLSWPLFDSSGVATPGWTSYSPLATNGNPAADSVAQAVQESFYGVAHSPGFWLPHAAQMTAALIMILFSRPIGRWLAGGLSDDDRRPPRDDVRA